MVTLTKVHQRLTVRVLAFNRARAWRTTEVLLVSVGGTGMIAFAATLHWLLLIAGIVWTGLTWTVIYTFIEKWERPV